ncbi:hypothetical protein [Membranihabitans maritimus]|uniref:hypothetical protein n=1 Tax=Membranihabitans maritimus TaxID=2904244 RepID=UPI001F27064F|nr:hypothetical protein [Membranihabitans maritimus]
MRTELKNYSFLLPLALFILSCGPSQSELDQLKKENQVLQTKIEEVKTELEDCKFGAEKLFEQIRVAYEKEDFMRSKRLFKKIENRHPETKYFTQAKAIYEEIDKIEKRRAEEQRIKEERAEQRRLRALNKLRKKHDDVAGTNWYKNSYFTHYNNRNLTSLYMGHKNNFEWLRLKMSYAGDDWIFFDEAYLSYDGNTIEVEFDKYDHKETDNSGGDVWEWIDVPVSDKIVDFLRRFCQSKNAKMRLSGKYTKTRTLTWNERQGIKDVLNGFDALNEE